MTAVPPGRLRVLLMSAVPTRDPHSGDVTYTEQLLANPPPGVEYTTYDSAARDGTLREIGSRSELAAAAGRHRAGPLLRGLGAAALRKVESGVRSTGRAFREPIRIMEADPDAFDLVHVHVFNTRFVGASPPVVMSAAGPLEWVYADAWGWSPDRVRRANQLDTGLATILDATLHARRLGRARRFIAFSEHLRSWMRDRGVDSTRIDVVPNYVEPPTTAPARSAGQVPRRLGFIAKDFNAKGGPDVLAAFEILRLERPDLELVIVGSETPPRLTLPDGVDWRPFVPRSELLTSLLPTIDVLLHPSHFDGLPYAPMEALALGIPLVVSEYRALPELARDGAGRVCRLGDVAGIAAATRDLLDPEVHARARASATRRFTAAYSSETQAPALRRSYDRALGTPSGGRPVRVR